MIGILLGLVETQLKLGLSVMVDSVFMGEDRFQAKEIARKHGARFRPIYTYVSDERVWEERVRRRWEMAPPEIQDEGATWERIQEQRKSFYPWKAGSALFKEIRVWSEHFALASAKIFLSGTFLGNDFAGDYRYTRVWRKGENGWQIVGGSVCNAPRNLDSRDKQDKLLDKRRSIAWQGQEEPSAPNSRQKKQAMNKNSSPAIQNPLKRVRESVVCATGFNPFPLPAIHLPTTGNHTSHNSSTTQNNTAPVSSSGGPGS